jgi:hypothetical protein
MKLIAFFKAYILNISIVGLPTVAGVLAVYGDHAIADVYAVVGFHALLP